MLASRSRSRRRKERIKVSFISHVLYVCMLYVYSHNHNSKNKHLKSDNWQNTPSVGCNVCACFDFSISRSGNYCSPHLIDWLRVCVFVLCTCYHINIQSTASHTHTHAIRTALFPLVSPLRCTGGKFSNRNRFLTELGWYYWTWSGEITKSVVVVVCVRVSCIQLKVELGRFQQLVINSKSTCDVIVSTLFSPSSTRKISIYEIYERHHGIEKTSNLNMLCVYFLFA